MGTTMLFPQDPQISKYAGRTHQKMDYIVRLMAEMRIVSTVPRASSPSPGSKYLIARALVVSQVLEGAGHYHQLPTSSKIKIGLPV